MSNKGTRSSKILTGAVVLLHNQTTMKVHTTNYQNTLIAIADDCPNKEGEVPPIKGDKKTAANLQFEMLIDAPYKFTSDDVLFETYAIRNGISPKDRKEAREAFFSKGQPCFRASPLTKRYGWGVHANEEGRIAIYPSGSEEYKKLSHDKNIQVVKAMRTSK